ncbi:Lon-insertion domain-containing protein [Shewanella maritima]|uniref:Lon-insertion domain-containing protein n=1 Tax=Shewanella maritima TaxID=2520507 RepID=UPI00373590FD
MTQTCLPSSALAPQFNLPAQLSSSIYSSHLLLGQQRVVDSFVLCSKLAEQHLFLADFPGVNRVKFIQALTLQASTPSDAYLVASKQNGDTSFHWQDMVVPENVGTITVKDELFTYLHGKITRAQLIGKVTKKANATQYEAGALAKHHYVYICVESLWKREKLWELLAQIIEDGQYSVNSELAPIPLNCKIVLVGSSLFFSHLREEDKLFMKQFAMLAEMNHELDLTKHSEHQYMQWLQAIAEIEQVQLDISAIRPLLWYSAKMVEHQQRLSLNMIAMGQLIAQANVYSNETQVSAKAVSTAIEKQIERHNSSEEYAAQNFDDKFITLPTDGDMIGQINGLTVIDTGDYSYGEPARISTTVHYGDGEVADIERKSELGGNIHAKGMMILSACLYRIFGRDAPLHLNANIVFEQSYQEIDGDSASLAEYCCLMSAIAETPILQSFGVTGALDQFGNVQAIGGVNEKIEGFFKLCKRRGLTGKQGVIIPRANILQLNLEPEVIIAVNEQQFFIHAIDHMDQAVELLMQLPAGEADEHNTFPDSSLYGKVQQRLDRLAGHEIEAETPSFLARILKRLRSTE